MKIWCSILVYYLFHESFLDKKFNSYLELNFLLQEIQLYKKKLRFAFSTINYVNRQLIDVNS